MLVKVVDLKVAQGLYCAGLLRWYDGEPWTTENGYAKPSEYCQEHAYIELEE